MRQPAGLTAQSPATPDRHAFHAVADMVSGAGCFLVRERGVEEGTYRL